ncbi:glycosyltransferase family 2 protein, partial [Lachnospiraceae bacterium]|nr:glycosyltransferase family 2 protein [Lachnospiraceae bacterium]
NMTVYSYFTFLSFIRRVASTDYVPALELDWYMLRDSCNMLRERCMEYYDTYTYTEKIDEYYAVRHLSDVQFSEPWVDLDTYIVDGCGELRWDYEELLRCKENYRFNEWGLLE